MIYLEREPTKTLATYLANLRYENLPTSVIDRVKVLLIDGLGCGLYGIRLPWGRIIVDYIRELRGKEEASIWGTMFKVPAVHAALANGVLIHSYELDDYHHKAKLHPSSVVLPAALAIGEALKTDGRTFITALVGGYETMIRVSLGIGPASAKKRGWHLTGICGPFGAAAAAGIIAGLNEKQMANALGLAGTQGAGLFAFTADGSMSKRFHPGRAAQSGLLAVSLVRGGFTGPTQILEAEDGGLCKAVSDNYHLERITEGLGDQFEILNVSLKPYSCCGSVQSAVNGVLKLREKYHIGPSNIDKIIIKTSKLVKEQNGWNYTPKSILQAQMSLQYCVAIALLEGDAFVNQFTEEKIRNKDVLKLITKIVIIIDEKIDYIYPRKFANQIDIRLTDGSQYSIYVEDPWGSPIHPLTIAEVKEKFTELSKGLLSPRNRQILYGNIEHLNDLRSVEELTKPLRGFKDVRK